MSSTPLVTAVVVTYNNSEVIDDCLSGIVGDPRVEVVVIDSGSSDDSVHRVRSHPGVRCIAHEENVGWTSGSNEGASASSARAVAFLNPDTRATSSKLIALASRLGGSVAAVSPRFVNGDGSPQSFYSKLPSPVTGPFLYLNSGQRIDEKLGRPVVRRHLYGERTQVPCPAHAGAACLVVDREVFSRLGGFDERMWIFFSDVDFSRRLAASGRRLYVDWDVEIPHLGGGSVRSLDLDSLQRIVQTDYVAYSRSAFDRPGRALTTCAIWAFSGMGPALMALLRGDTGSARKCIDRARIVLRR